MGETKSKPARAQAQQAAAAPAQAQQVATAAPPAQAQALVAGAAPVGQLAVADTLADTFEGFAGAGMETVSSKDVMIPRLGIIQALSDQRKRQHANYIEEAQEGDICDTGTNELMPRPLHVIPVMWSKAWLEWAPRSSQKGLIAIHTDERVMEQARPQDVGPPLLPNGNLIVETASWYVLNLTAGRRPSFIPMASTQLKRSRRWMTWAQAERLVNAQGREYVPPLFYRSYYLDTVQEQRNNNIWFSWQIMRGPALPEIPNWKNLLEQCIQFRDSLTSGTMRADLANATDDPSVVEGHAEPAGTEQRM